MIVSMRDAGDSTDFDLDRFVLAEAPVFDTAVTELRAGRKKSHWMWFVFPQLRGLGRSMTADLYGLASLAEAKAYLRHPILAPMLEACTRSAIEAKAPSLSALFGSPDDVKFISSMTLFEAAAETSHSLFGKALDQWNQGRRDARTLAMICA